MAREGRGAVGFTFTETMGGFIAPVAAGAGDYRAAAARGRAAGDALRFRVRVTIDDLGRFIRDPAHRAALSGTVESARFGPARPIEEGVFNLFQRDAAGRLAMRYDLTFTDTAGRRYRLEGFKDVHNDRVVDLWADTTTLFTTVRRADEPGEPILARGILHIRAIDLIPQVASMRGLHAPGRGARGGALARFGAFFGGQLWHEYARPPARPGTSRHFAGDTMRRSVSASAGMPGAIGEIAERRAGMATDANGQRGRTALITGASGGIGAELARVFASEGFDLILVARTEEKLRALGEELSARYGVRCTAIRADLAERDAPATLVADVERQGFVVDVLVNNAGFGNYGLFKDADRDREMALIQVNIAALTELTHRFLPGMVERRRGHILNLASTLSFMPGPLMATYYASKAYVLYFSEAINDELQGTGVTVTALCPGATASGFQVRAKNTGTKFLRGRTLDDAAWVARVGYDGLMRRQSIVIPGVSNRLMTLAPRFLPRRLVLRTVRNAQEQDH